MQIKKPTLTSDQKLVLNGVLSLLASTLATGFSAADQYYSTHATINISVLIIVFLSVFGTGFGAALYAYVPSHITQELQALKDTIDELNGKTAASPVTTTPTLSSPLLVVHTNNATFPGVPVEPQAVSVPGNEPATTINTLEDAGESTAKVEAVQSAG